MGSSDLFSEKFAMYFATMNPLASKIYSDIEGIEDYVKSHGPPAVTYGEKCNIVDKFLIYDHLPMKNDAGKLNKRLAEYQKGQISLNKSETSLDSLMDNPTISEAELLQPVFYNDSVLDQDHESVLLTSVAPKKPEKYVYDENNYWLDEHSVAYSGCTETQAKACKLHQFLDNLPPPPQPHKSHLKYRAPPIPKNTASVCDSEEDYIIPRKKQEEEEENRYSKIDKMDGASKKYSSVAVPLFGGVFGDAPPPPRKNSGGKQEGGGNEEDLPKQVKNNDLIAELQAKLKTGKSGGGACEARGSLKLHKPKAPPPPPPQVAVQLKPPGGAVKVENKLENETQQSMPSGREISDEFLVDISSPCKVVTRKTGLDFLDNW